MTIRTLFLVCLLPMALAGCGMYTPAKSELISDEVHPREGDPKAVTSDQADYENKIVSHVECELREAIFSAQMAFHLPWLKRWGTAVTLTITAEDQSGVNPGLSIMSPMQNVVKNFPVGGAVTLPQSFSGSIGATVAATATRSETIQYTYLNSDLLRARAENPSDCKFLEKGFQIDGDLKIRQFIFDKAMIGKMGNASEYGPESKGFKSNSFLRPNHPWEWPIYNSLTEEIQFLSAFGGSATPTWKLARISANTTGNLVAAQRTYTNDLIITMGPVTPPSEYKAAALDAAAQNQHNAKVNANAIATSVQSQMH